MTLQLDGTWVCNGNITAWRALPQTNLLTILDSASITIQGARAHAR